MHLLEQTARTLELARLVGREGSAQRVLPVLSMCETAHLHEPDENDGERKPHALR